MPDHLSVATYAAGASLATIALVYVFAPTYFLDSAPSGTSSYALSALSGRKTGVVGLANAANDCFINSVLQALAGLGDLRIYLIRETHRRQLDKAGVYSVAVPENAVLGSSGSASNSGGGGGAAAATSSRRQMPVWKVEGLQAGLVTQGLKEMLDQLNERPIYRKVITARGFVRVLEVAFRQRISRQQQDAQEFLQVVAERLCDEYHAGQRARCYARQGAALHAETVDPGSTGTQPTKRPDEETQEPTASQGADGDDEEEGFPMEGKIESQIECLTCGFKPRPSGQTFCTLTLNVPQVSSTSLSACFDSMLKTELIDEFKCEKCRLVHAQERLETELAKIVARSPPPSVDETKTRGAIAALQQAIATDPERPPADVVLPDARFAPKRRIARHFRLVQFPKILAIHLSRSIYHASSMSQKNSAKVAFPERLPLGGLLHQRRYKLISVVMHKGSHQSGHYESFRRQTTTPPYANPSPFRPSSVYTPTASASPSTTTTPHIRPSDGTTAAEAPTTNGCSPASSTTELPPLATTPTDTSASTSASVPQRLTRTESLAGKRSFSPSLRGRSASGSSVAGTDASGPLSPRSTPREEMGGSSGSDPTSVSAGTGAESASLRSVTRSTWSRIAPSSRSGSRAGSRRGSVSGGNLLWALPTRSKDSNGKDTNGKATNGKDVEAQRHKKNAPDRWWRISDDKVREASTRDVLGMQREVYLLFYELEREGARRG